MSVPLFINQPDILSYSFYFMHPFSVDTASPRFFFLHLSWNNPSWRICGRLIKNFWGTSGGLKSSNRVGVGKCYGSPPTASRSSQNTLIFVFHLGGEATREHFYTDEHIGMRAYRRHVCVCVCVRTNTKSQQSHLLILTWVSPLNLVTRIIVY